MKGPQFASVAFTSSRPMGTMTVGLDETEQTIVIGHRQEAFTKIGTSPTMLVWKWDQV